MYGLPTLIQVKCCLVMLCLVMLCLVNSLAQDKGVRVANVPVCGLATKMYGLQN